MDNVITIISLILTAIVSLVSIAVSLITIKINNKHQRLLKAYDKKCEVYQEFFELYANYIITNEFDITQTKETAIKCLLISNKKTTYFLNVLLKWLKGEDLLHERQKDKSKYFTNCIDCMKEELNLV